jgi:A/G-specific adenine glycosylase
VLCRYFGVDGWPGKSAVAHELWRLAEQHTPHSSVAQYNQAMMDLGATVCTRGNPRCEACPLAAGCLAKHQGRISELPAAKPKKSRPQRSTNMLIVRTADEYYLERRPPSGIWGGLWSFPELDTLDELPAWCERTLSSRPVAVDSLQVLRHSFSHFDLDIVPLVVRVDVASGKVADNANGNWYPLDSRPPVGLAAPVEKLMQSVIRKE